ncbi:hypothetical protein ABVT39_024438 [Epinephelus coioides]
MTLRGGKTVRLPALSDDDSDTETGHMCPILTRASGRSQYKPWPFMDMIGLAKHLPVLTDGADKWIMALEETTAGIRLALGDVKALLTYVAGKQTTHDMFVEARLSHAATSNTYDDEDFGTHHNRVWQQLRKQYPEERDPSKLEGETLKDDECSSRFLHNFQQRWKEETGEAWNANKITQSLFKMMAKKAMSEDVQRCLDGVVELMKMELPMFSEHIAHHMEHYRKEKKKQEDDNKQLANKLTQLQSGELSKLAKKEKEKTKIQAPIIMANQAAPQPVQHQLTPQMAEQTAPADPNATEYASPVNTHHHYYYPCQAPRNNSQRPTRGRGRGGLRGGLRRHARKQRCEAARAAGDDWLDRGLDGLVAVGGRIGSKRHALDCVAVLGTLDYVVF